MANFRMVFPCGHERIRENTKYCYGARCCGARPIELHITGTIINPITNKPEKAYEWHRPILHPVLGVMTHDGEVIKECRDVE